MRTTPARATRNGAAAIEFAFLFPLVFAIFFAFVEHGRYMMVKDIVQNAAREGARYAAVTTNDLTIDDDDIKAWVLRWMVGQEAHLTNYECNVYKTDATGTIPVDKKGNVLPGTWKSLQYSQLIAVQIKGTHTVWLPILTMLPPTMDLDVKAISSAEAN